MTSNVETLKVKIILEEEKEQLICEYANLLHSFL